jgi:hypothetical protein
MRDFQRGTSQPSYTTAIGNAEEQKMNNAFPPRNKDHPQMTQISQMRKSNLGFICEICVICG